MYTLYGSPSTAGTAIHWMLLELDVPFDLKLLDFDKAEHKTPDYLALNPDGVVPTLIVDGAPITQMAGIATLLAERHPEAGFAPPVGAAERAEYLSWTLWLANSFQPNFRAWFYPHAPAGPDQANAVRASARAQIEQAWTRIDARLAGCDAFLFGGEMTIADFLLVMLVRWSRNMPRPAADWPALGAYLGRIAAMTSLHEVQAREGLADWPGEPAPSGA